MAGEKEQEIMAEESIKIIAQNKKAHFEYFLSDFTEAGIELKGTEIKSIRFNGASLNESYAIIKNNEAYILGLNIAPFFNGNIFNHEPLRTRKLLLHKREILKLSQKIKEKGYTLVCTKVYFKKGKVKVEIALAKGKKLFDKRETIKKRDLDRESKKQERY
jgi:SsrA-binding protein